MALFQKSVQNDYLNRIQDSSIKEYWEYYDSYFNNPEKQKLIEGISERKFYSEFISKLFGKCLGYNTSLSEDQNYFIEEKNETDSGKADGAVKVNGDVVAVMEFKDNTTKNLKDVESQAFGYKVKHSNKCKYVVTCNFKELWFYIDNTTSIERFNLFNLSYDGFKLLWLCLSYESISTNLPEQIKNKSVTEEEKITKKLYSDYSLFRNEIFNDLIDKNPQFDKLLLFKKTQKLLDRFLFIFFAEDRLLLPTNSIAKIIKKWEDDIAFGEEKSLYTTFVFYFNLLNKGRPASKEREEIFAYNGGLFAPDEILDSIVIDDELLSKHTKKLSSYDFISDVSVNILGHIFEHSLSQIEEIQNEIAGIETDKSKSKRKKDGVFYTPAYITKYIVENTVGKLCKEKREELEFNEAEFVKDRKGRQKNTLKKLSNQLDNYREWLLGITICDPSCGSGAFLVEALNFLIDEHNYIDELRASVFGESIQFSDITASILENNLYGVDINEESVEIAKLSLWLRTAQKGRKLTSLSDNLKCGNSLIDDPEVAGDKAFNWQNEFPEVFGNGGFDVVIGNPPYVQHRRLMEYSSHFKNQFSVYTGTSDLSVYFYEQAINILKDDGFLAYINTNKFFNSEYGLPLRNYLTNYQINTIINFEQVSIFKDALVSSTINLIRKSNPLSIVNYVEFNKEKLADLDFQNELISRKREITNNYLKKNSWLFTDPKISLIIKKIKGKGKAIGDVEDLEIKRGITTGYDDAFLIEKSHLLNTTHPEISKSILRGKDIKRYELTESGLSLLFIPWHFPLHLDESISGASQDAEESLKIKYPQLYEHLLKHKDKLSNRNKSETGTRYEWYALQRCAASYYELFDKPKIVWGLITGNWGFSLDESGNFLTSSSFFLTSNNINLKLLLGLLNSKLYEFYFKNVGEQSAGGAYVLKKTSVEKFIYPSIKENNLLLENINEMRILSNNLNKYEANFLMLVKSKFGDLKLTTKLRSWHQLDFNLFLKDLEKVRKKYAKENETEYNKISLEEQAEWMQYFNEQRQKADELKRKIEKTDREIDQMVYELYGLTQEEIEIVENATK